MKKYLLIIVLSITTLAAARAQEYKVRKSTGKIILNLPAVMVEGYSGNEIIFSFQHREGEFDPSAEGLQAINSAGYRDNTGLGISVVEKGATMEVNEVLPDQTIKVLIPKGVIVSFVFNKMTKEKDVLCRNMENEIEIESYNNNIFLENITGPITVRALYGAVFAKFSSPVKGPVHITSIQSSVDVSIPVGTKANLTLKSGHSTILASPDLKIEVEKREVKDIEDNSSMINAKLNGGGIEFTLMSQYGKIYLRKTE
jgi:hypothetical protein